MNEEKSLRRQRNGVLDDADRRIIAVLQRDGRAQSTAIGEELGLSGSLVSTRIRTMDTSGLMRVVAIGDFRIHGYQMLARIRLKVSERSPEDVALELAAREDVLAVHITSGRYAVSCLYAFRNAQDMIEAARDLSVAIDGVDDIDVEVLNQVYRYVPAVGPLLVNRQTKTDEPIGPSPQAEDAHRLADGLDRAIAKMLAKDARLSFRRLAVELGVAEGTIRSRVKRLQSAGWLNLTPIVDIARAQASEDGSSGAQHMMFLTITCLRGMETAVRERVLAFPQVHGLYDANAALRLVAVCVLPSVEAAAEVCNQIIAFDGVRQAECEIMLKTIKYNATIGPLATSDDTGRSQNGPARRQS